MEHIDGETFELVAKLLGVRADSHMGRYYLERALEERPDISGISTAQDAKKAAQGRNESDEWTRDLLVKWRDLALEESRNATTLDEVRAAYISSPFDSEAEMIAMKKWLDFCSNADDIEEIYPHYYHKKTFICHWNSQAWLMLLEKHISLLSNFEDLYKLRLHHITSGTLEATSLQHRFYQFSLEKIWTAKTFDEVREAYQFSGMDWNRSYDVGREAIKKVVELLRAQHQCPGEPVGVE